MFEARRSDIAGDKAGGGVIIYCKTSEGLISNQFSPDIVDPDCFFVNNERIWVTFESTGFKTAVCGVYMFCQSPTSSQWNERIYSTIASEQASLRSKGFRTLILGDLNGHIGNLPNVGILGNKPDVNSNGNCSTQPS
jgi:hypothetical protein